MTGIEFDMAKQDILDGKTISFKTYTQLKELAKQYGNAKTKACTSGDISKADYFRKLALKTTGLIEKASVCKEV